MKNHDVLRTGKTDERSNHDSGETKNRSRMLSVNLGEHPEEYTGVFDVSSRQSRVFGEKKNSFKSPS